MILVLAIVGVILIGWAVPGIGMRLVPGTAGMVIGVAAAWLLGFAYVWGAAVLTAQLTGADLKDEVEKAVNAWKLILLIAPAAALHRRRRAEPPDRTD